MNPVKGGSNINLNTNTNSYIRAGPGRIIGSSGADGYGTGINYTPKGQITLGLTKEDTNSVVQM